MTTLMPHTLKTPITILAAILALFLVPGANAADEGANLDLFVGKKWTFYPGYEFPGAKGSQRIEQVDGHDALILSYDFTGGGAYVAAKAPVDIGEGSAGLSFVARSAKEAKLVVRLVDSGGQTHQYQLLYTEPNTWQKLDVNFTDSTHKHFGGANDGIFQYPIKEIWFCVGKGKATAEPGDVSFADAALVK